MKPRFGKVFILQERMQFMRITTGNQKEKKDDKEIQELTSTNEGTVRK